MPLASATRTAWPDAVVICSKTKSPLTRCPATISATPTPVTRTNGPAGTSTETVVPPTTNDWATAAPVVLTASEKEPLSVKPAPAAMLTAPASDPASPPLAAISRPLIALTDTSPAASESEPPLTPTRTIFEPDGVVVCSNAKLAWRSRPWTVIFVGASERTRTSPAAESSSIARLAVASRTAFGSASATSTLSEPTTPVRPIVRVAVPAFCVAVRIGAAAVPPSFRTAFFAVS